MIKEFKGDYRFLSNFFKTDVVYEGQVYPSSEHAYMAAKTTDPDLRKRIQMYPSAADAKRIGRQLTLRPGWEQMKEQVMYTVLLDKFTRNETIKAKLLATGDQELIEGNWWGDKTWGVCLKTNQGKNLLGKTLMKIRSELQPKAVKLLIAGGRDFNNEDLMRDRLQELESMGLFKDGVELVCGMARGADMLGHRVFKMNNLPIHAHPADWEGLGKRAGFVRNAEMGNECDLALIFWDGKSKGTKHMIDYLDKLNKKAFVVSY